MKYSGVKFILNLGDCNYFTVEDVIDNAKGILNWQFDENLNATLTEDDIDYSVRDVFNFANRDVKEIIESFFDFTFDSIIDVPLYKFLVLKNNENLTLLANINSLIFDYSSINDFYELFVNSDKSCLENDLDSYYGDVKDYLNSSDFLKDSTYWRNYILNSSDYVKFYNLKDNNYESQTINVNRDCVSIFIEDNKCSLLDFYGSIISLYLSRIDRHDGCLLKTIIPTEKHFDKNTYLKIDVDKDSSFRDLLDGFDSAYGNVIDNTKVDVENYLDEKVSFYSIYDFSDLNENIRIYNDDESALTFNIYKNSLELVYNTNLFTDIYAEHMARNIESLINNILNSPDQIISDIDILSDEEKDLLINFCKGNVVEVEKDKFFSQSFRQYANANPNAIAVDDGVNQKTYGQLEKSTNSIADDLYKNYNIGPGSRVGLMLPRDYHYPELGLALNKIAAAFVPIDLSFPINRIEHMLIIAQSQHLITTKDIAQNLDLNVNIIAIEDLNCEIGYSKISLQMSTH